MMIHSINTLLTKVLQTTQYPEHAWRWKNSRKCPILTFRHRQLRAGTMEHQVTLGLQKPQENTDVLVGDSVIVGLRKIRAKSYVNCSTSSLTNNNLVYT